MTSATSNPQMRAMILKIKANYASGLPSHDGITIRHDGVTICNDGITTSHDGVMTGLRATGIAGHDKVMTSHD